MYLYYYAPEQEAVTVLSEKEHHRYGPAEKAAQATYKSDTYMRETIKMPEEEYVRQKLNVVADDIVLCVDAKTGKTIWKHVFEGVTTFGGRATIHCVPCVDDGKLFVGTRYGTLAAFDAAKGTLLWTRDNAKTLAQAKEQLAQAIERKLHTGPFACGTYQVIAADGVVYSSQIGKGVDAATGEDRWQAIDKRPSKPQPLNHAMPLRWFADGKWYFLFGESLVEAATGKVCWQLKGRHATGGRGGGSPAFGDGYLVYGAEDPRAGRSAIGSPRPRRSSSGRRSHNHRSTMTTSSRTSTCTVSPCVYRGKAYVVSRGADQQKKGGTYKSCWLTVYDVATGKELQDLEIPHVHGCFRSKNASEFDVKEFPGLLSGGTDGCSSTFAFNGRLCYRAAGKSAGGRLSVWRIAEDGTVTFEELWQPETFDVAHTPAVVDGRIYLRGVGQILCYDCEYHLGEGASHMRYLLTITIVLSACMTQAFATTHWFLGTILRVESTDGRVVLHVLQDLHNYNGEDDLTIQTWKIDPQWIIYLNGKESTAAEAFTPGRSIAMFDDFIKTVPADERGKTKKKTYAVMVATAAGSGLVVPLTDPTCSLYMINMDQPGILNGLCDGTPIPDKRSTQESIRAKWAAMKIRPRLILEQAEDGTLHGFAFSPSRHNSHPRWHPADVSAVQVEGGAVSGTVKVSYTSTAGKIIPASYNLTGKSDGSGSFSGTCGEEKVAGKLTVTGLSSTRPESDFRLWLRCEDSRLKGAGWGFLNASFTANKSSKEAQLCFRKGHLVATITDMHLTREGRKIHGTCTADGQAMALEAEVFDGRLVVGYLNVGEGETVSRVSVSGGLVLPESAPTIHPKHD